MSKRKPIYRIDGTGPAGRSPLCWTESEGMANLLITLLAAHYTDLTITKE